MLIVNESRTPKIPIFYCRTPENGTDLYQGIRNFMKYYNNRRHRGLDKEISPEPPKIFEHPSNHHSPLQLGEDKQWTCLLQCPLKFYLLKEL